MLHRFDLRAAFIVDQAVTVTEDEFGASTLGDLVRRGRYFGLEVHGALWG